MNREKMRKQVRKLREKKSKRPVMSKKEEPISVRSVPKPQVKRGVVKVESLSSKRGTPTPTATSQADRKQHMQIMRTAQKRHSGCGGCRRKIGDG